MLHKKIYLLMVLMLTLSMQNLAMQNEEKLTTDDFLYGLFIDEKTILFPKCAKYILDQKEKEINHENKQKMQSLLKKRKRIKSFGHSYIEFETPPHPYDPDFVDLSDKYHNLDKYNEKVIQYYKDLDNYQDALDESLGQPKKKKRKKSIKSAYNKYLKCVTVKPEIKQKKYVCPLCKKLYKQGEYLGAHFDKEHPHLSGKHRKLRESKYDIHITLDKETETYHCKYKKYCNYEGSKYKAHARYHVRKKCSYFFPKKKNYRKKSKNK